MQMPLRCVAGEGRWPGTACKLTAKQEDCGNPSRCSVLVWVVDPGAWAASLNGDMGGSWSPCQPLLFGVCHALDPNSSNMLGQSRAFEGLWCMLYRGWE